MHRRLSTEEGKRQRKWILTLQHNIPWRITKTYYTCQIIFNTKWTFCLSCTSIHAVYEFFNTLGCCFHRFQQQVQFKPGIIMDHQLPILIFMNKRTILNSIMIHEEALRANSCFQLPINIPCWKHNFCKYI